MSTIRVIYSEEPKFPATDQHPDAVRYRVGGHVVDAVGGEPTQAEVDAVLNSPTTDKSLRLEDVIAAMEQKGVLTRNDVLAARGKTP